MVHEQPVNGIATSKHHRDAPPTQNRRYSNGNSQLSLRTGTTTDHSLAFTVKLQAVFPRQIRQLTVHCVKSRVSSRQTLIFATLRYEVISQQTQWFLRLVSNQPTVGGKGTSDHYLYKHTVHARGKYLSNIPSGEKQVREISSEYDATNMCKNSNRLVLTTAWQQKTRTVSPPSRHTQCYASHRNAM